MLDYKECFKQCYTIRAFEKKIEEEFGKGNMRGTTHGCIGQEVIPVIVMNYINQETDYIVGTHRCHGQVLAYNMDPYRLFCEMMGRRDGFVNGMGGSQHIKNRKFLTNGITGGMVVVGNGIAMSIKKNQKQGIVVSFLGDGGFNEGYVQETFNLASHYELPILFVCENNHYAMSTPTEKFSAGTFKRRIQALDIKYYQAYSGDVEQLDEMIGLGTAFVRNEQKPAFIEVSTARLCGHSKSDKMEYMSSSEKNHNAKKDPLKFISGKLMEDEIEELKCHINETIKDAYVRADKCPEM